MDLIKIKQKLSNIKSCPMETSFYYAVLVPLVKVNGKLHLVYQVRSLEIERQPGEISFPGGQVETEESFKEAAIRETHEEIGIDKNKIEIISELDYIAGKSDFFLYPYLGYLHDTDVSKLQYSKDEVEELFTVPLDFFLETKPELYNVKYLPDFDDAFPFHLIQNGRDYKWGKIEYPVYFYKYNNYIIWGMTAKITYNLVQKLKSNK